MRGDGVVEDVDGDWTPKYERVGGDDDGFDFPLQEGSFLAESLHRRAKVLLPKFRLKAAALRTESPPLIFFLGQNDLYTRRWAPEVGRGGHNPPGRAWAPWRALVGPLWYLFAPIFIKYSIKNPREVSAHLELCRIGSLT